MYEIDVSWSFEVDMPRVFEQIADHATFLTGNGVSCRVVAPGGPSPNGLGAVREVRTASLTFVERVTAFRAPDLLEYRIQVVQGPFGVPLPIEHERGWLELAEEGAHTRVRWRSRFRVTVPGVGRLFERRVGPQLAGAFRGFLGLAASRLAEPTSG